MDKREKTGIALNNLVLLVLFGGFFLGLYLQIESRLILVERITIVNSGIPSSFDGVQIAFLSDINHGMRFSKKRVHNLVKKVNLLMADIIILGGDYVSGSGNFIDPVWEELANLTPLIFGPYGVFGESDYWEGTTLTMKAMKNSGVIPLRNSGVWLKYNGGRIHLGGVGDFTVDATHLSGAIGNTKGDDFSILVSHNPNFFHSSSMKQREEGVVDLMLSGHTHGGYNLLKRIVPYSGFEKPFVNEEGLIKIDDLDLLISGGIGTDHGKIRFLTPAKIYLITLKQGEVGNLID